MTTTTITTDIARCIRARVDEDHGIVVFTNGAKVLISSPELEPKSGGPFGRVDFRIPCSGGAADIMMYPTAAVRRYHVQVVPESRKQDEPGLPEAGRPSPSGKVYRDTVVPGRYCQLGQTASFPTALQAARWAACRVNALLGIKQVMRDGYTWV